jgi:hypothetical protein
MRGHDSCQIGKVAEGMKRATSAVTELPVFGRSERSEFRGIQVRPGVIVAFAKLPVNCFLSKLFGSRKHEICLCGAVKTTMIVLRLIRGRRERRQNWTMK